MCCNNFLFIKGGPLSVKENMSFKLNVVVGFVFFVILNVNIGLELCQTGVNNITYIKPNGATQEMAAKLACQAVYGSCNITKNGAASCAQFYYYYGSQNDHCQCDMPSGIFEWIYESASGRLDIGNGYCQTGETVGTNEPYTREPGPNGAQCLGNDNTGNCWKYINNYYTDCVSMVSPTLTPTNFPTKNPTQNPTDIPTTVPTITPTVNPTVSPTTSPTKTPSESPSIAPTISPTMSPFIGQTAPPTTNPTRTPTANPSVSPVLNPTNTPTLSPNELTSKPTMETKAPTTSTAIPSQSPSQSPSNTRELIEPVGNVITPNTVLTTYNGNSINNDNILDQDTSNSLSCYLTQKTRGSFTVKLKLPNSQVCIHIIMN